MAFYRSLLEEEIKVSGLENDDTNTDPVVAELIDDIDKQMDNAEEVSAAQDATFGDEPGPDAEDVVSESFMIIAESEMNWNMIMQEAAIDELNESVVLESIEGIKNWFSKAKKAIVDFFTKVFQVIKRWSSDLFAMMHTNKGFATKYADRITAGEKIYNTSKDVKKLKGYPFTYNFNNIGSEFTNLLTLNDKIKNMAHSLKSNGLPQNSTGSGISSMDDNFKNEMKKFDIPFDNERIDLNKTRENWESKFRFNDTKHVNQDPAELTTGMKASEIINLLKDASKIKKATSETLDNAKKDLKASVAVMDDLEKWFKNETNSGENENKAFAAVASLNRTIKGINNGVHVIRSCAMHNLRKYIHQARRFGNYYVQLANKGNAKMKGFQKESAFTSGLDLI